MGDQLFEKWKKRYEESRVRDDVDFDTLSSVPVEPLYGGEESAADEQIGVPGEYPFTRGIYPSGYRGRLWTMRQFA
ncbi:MAG: methylmalonyl-CoA mutase, partial [Actinobacteria bacterium]|nr:methylmalonyl-CoA mutase [Actinomycetota bacterium]